MHWWGGRRVGRLSGGHLRGVAETKARIYKGQTVAIGEGKRRRNAVAIDKRAVAATLVDKLEFVAVQVLDCGMIPRHHVIRQGHGVLFGPADGPDIAGAKRYLSPVLELQEGWW